MPALPRRRAASDWKRGVPKRLSEIGEAWTVKKRVKKLEVKMVSCGYD